MADQNTVAIAKAVLADLNTAAAGFATTFTATRVWLVQWDLEDLANLHVVVTPGPVEEELQGRASKKISRDIDIVLARRIDDRDLTGPIDTLVNLFDEIADYYQPPKQLTTAEDVHWVLNQAPKAIFAEKAAIARQHLEDNRTYLAVLRTHWLRQKVTT